MEVGYRGSYTTLMKEQYIHKNTDYTERYAQRITLV